MRDQGGKSAGRNASRKQQSPEVQRAPGSSDSAETLRRWPTELPTAVLETDLHGTITAWNKEAERMFGHSASQAIGQPLSQFVAPARRGALQELTARAGRGETSERIETLGVRRDTSLVPFTMTVTPCRD